MSRLDLWDGVAVAGAGLAGGGIWMNWGAPWAFIFWGGLLLGGALLRAWLLTREKGAA